MLSRRIEPNRADGQQGLPRLFHLDALGLDTDSHFQIRRYQLGSAIGDFELDVLEDLFRAASRSDQSGGLKGGQQLLAITRYFHDCALGCGVLRFLFF